MNELAPRDLHALRSADTWYERTLICIEQSVRVDEAKTFRDEAAQVRFAARQAKDRTLQAHAAELQMRAERRLGEILIRAKEAGQLAAHRPRRRQAELDLDGAAVTRVTLAEAGIDRKLSMTAQQLAGSPESLFERIVAEARAKIEAGRAIVINPAKDLRTADKQLRRRLREAQLAAKQRALPERVYGVIYADPEWQFEVRSEAGMDRSADNHYPTSDLATIKARPVGTLAAPDCVLALWATAPMLPQALEAMRFWGFAYVSHTVWDKQDLGTGYWFRNRHELLLIGTRGNVPAPAMGTQYPSVVSARPGRHSEKPEWAYEMLEAYFPSLPKIELNARRRRPGWDAWGLEAPDDTDTESTAAASGGMAVDAAGTGRQSPVPAAPDRAPGGADEPLPLIYRYALEAVADRVGRLDQESAAPVLQAAALVLPVVPWKQVAADIGHPAATVRWWARRLGLASADRKAAVLKQHHFAPQAVAPGAP